MIGSTGQYSGNNEDLLKKSHTGRIHSLFFQP